MHFVKTRLRAPTKRGTKRLGDVPDFPISMEPELETIGCSGGFSITLGEEGYTIFLDGTGEAHEDDGSYFYW